MRTHYWSYLVNEEGQPVNEANISIHINGTSTTAWVYLQQSGGSAVNAAPQVQTNDEGFFEFWVAGASESHGYSSDQKFAIEWSKPGVISDGGIDDVIIYIAPDPVDETDTDTTKNKLVSNYLANYWSDKASVISMSAGSSDWTSSAGISPSAQCGCSAQTYYHDFEHNLNNLYPVIEVWDIYGETVMSYTGEYIDTNTTRIWTESARDRRVTFIG
jgi:hypothetical protein